MAATYSTVALKNWKSHKRSRRGSDINQGVSLTTVGMIAAISVGVGIVIARITK